MRTYNGPGMSGSGRSARRWRAVALLAAGLAVGVAMTATPVSGHIGNSVSHLWNAHTKLKTDARYYTKAQSNTRFLGSGAKAADAELLDGLESTELVQGTGRALGSGVAIPVDSSASVVSIAGVVNLTYFCGAGGGVLVLANQRARPWTSS
jgi:hypothetical protein